MTISAIILAYKREPNVGRIIESLRCQPVDEIILINNNPEHLFRIKDVKAVNCSVNFGCSIRHAMGLVAEGEWCLFVDDDVLPEEGMVQNLEEWGEQLPESVLGLYGRRLRPGRFPYSKSPMLSGGGAEAPVPVDVVVGKVHYCRREKLALPFRLKGKLPPFDHFRCDDIALCLANGRMGHMNYLVPFGDHQGVGKLNEFGYGLGHEEGWWETRDEAVRAFIGGGDGNQGP